MRRKRRGFLPRTFQERSTGGSRASLRLSGRDTDARHAHGHQPIAASAPPGRVLRIRRRPLLVKAPLLVPKRHHRGPKVDASRAAVRHVCAKGGRVYVWLKWIGGDWWVEKATTSCPPGNRMWEEYDEGAFTLAIERRLDTPDGVRLRMRRWWPHDPISVWTGAEPSYHDLSLTVPEP